MSKSARSIFIFGIYLAVLGVFTFAIPNLVLGVLGIPATTDGWVRITGMLIFLLGYYYIETGRRNLTAFFPLTIHARVAVFLFLIAFYLLGFTPAVLILVGTIDLLGALWTAYCLHPVNIAA